MARKLIRESEFSGIVRKSLPDFDVIRCETRLEDGFSDLLAIHKQDGTSCFIELKQIDHFTNTGFTHIDLDPMQAIFLWERVKAIPSVGAAVMLRVGKHDIYTFPARLEPQWCHWIRGKMYPDQVEMPLCFKHTISQIRTAVGHAYDARFTPAALARAA